MARKTIACIDFDGTIVEHAFPNIGPPMPLAFEVLRAMKENGYILILFTCREDDVGKRKYLTEAVEFCKRNGVDFDGVNETPIEHDFREKGKRRKPYAHLYIDDRNWLTSLDWGAIAHSLHLEDCLPLGEGC